MGYHRNGLRVALAALVSAAANDPIRNAEKLCGANSFASTGNGIPGIYDLPGGKFRLEPPEETPQVAAIGSVIEAGVNWSTRNLDNRLNQLGIPATFVYRDTGTHSWGNRQDDFESSWPTLAKGLYSAPYSATARRRRGEASRPAAAKLRAGGFSLISGERGAYIGGMLAGGQ
ncbi:hypothetical protein APR11_001635 [Nocardia amikacinitolerans]|uniref:hypothetical protein n=1 Tax=Nocardia amikacinitolerans TaxID=756689 RepID=UPI000BE29F29|nr:hypothetical protein [Nocardia amikacinitolerans]MCP2295228.1 hypothetical protein [Nocardia amikacinitolerans]